MIREQLDHCPACRIGRMLLCSLWRPAGRISVCTFAVLSDNCGVLLALAELRFCLEATYARPESRRGYNGSYAG